MIDGAYLGSTGPIRSKTRKRKHIKKACRNSPTELFEDFMPLAAMLAEKYKKNRPKSYVVVDDDDLEQICRIGLWKTALRFDETKGCSFESYACLRIKGAVFDELRRFDAIGRAQREKVTHFGDAKKKLEQQQGHRVSDAEVAETLGMSQKHFDELLSSLRFSILSLDEMGSPENDSSSDFDEPTGYAIIDSEVTSPNELAHTKILALEVLQQMEIVLTGQERRAMALYFFEDMTLREIGIVYGVTESRICQMMARSCKKIRDTFTCLT